MLVFTGQMCVSLQQLLNRPEILALRRDLDLELVYSSRYNPKGFKSRFNHVYTALDRQPKVALKPRISCECFVRRNHHYKNFSNVYESANNYENLSFDWD